MKIFLLYFVIVIGCILIVWAIEGNGSSSVIASKSMAWHVPAFIITTSAAILNGIEIWKWLFKY